VCVCVCVCVCIVIHIYLYIYIGLTRCMPPPLLLASYVGKSEVGKIAAPHRPPITPYIFKMLRRIYAPCPRETPARDCLPVVVRVNPTYSSTGGVLPVESYLVVFRVSWDLEAISTQLLCCVCSSATSLAARYLEKKTRRFFIFFASPPPSCFPGFPQGWPDDWSKQALRIKKKLGIKTFSRVYPKKGEHAPGK